MSFRPRRWLIALLLVAALLWTLPWLLPLGFEPQRLPERPFADSRWLELPQARLHAQHWIPEGPARGRILLVHGFAGSSFSWREIAGPLREGGFELLAVDLPAFGYSTRAPVEASDAQLLRATIAAVWPEREDPLLAMGHSMGADPVYRLALEPPPGLDAVVLVGGAPLFRGRAQTGTAAYLLRLPPARRAVEVYASWRLLNAERIGMLLASAYGVEPDDAAVAGYLAPLQIEGSTAAILRRMLAPRPGLAHDPSAAPRAPKAEVVLIWGENDRWVPVSRGQEALSRIEGARLEVLPGLGHNPMETAPSQFLQRLPERWRP